MTTKELSNTTQMVLIFTLLLIAFFVWGWSQNGRYQLRVEKGGVFAYLIDSRSGKTQLFYVNGELKFEHLDTIEIPRKKWFPDPIDP